MSGGEILHYVQMPPHPASPSSHDITLASRIKSPVNGQGEIGIHQIFLVPKANKACILTNGTLNFYALPELSPAFPHPEPLKCGWVGGAGLEADEESEQNGGCYNGVPAEQDQDSQSC